MQFFKLLVCVLLFVSCQSRNQNNAENYSNKSQMNWKIESSDLLTTTSQAKDKKELISDLAQVYSKIHSEKCFKNKQLLALQMELYFFLD